MVVWLILHVNFKLLVLNFKFLESLLKVELNNQSVLKITKSLFLSLCLPLSISLSPSFFITSSLHFLYLVIGFLLSNSPVNTATIDYYEYWNTATIIILHHYLSILFISNLLIENRKRKKFRSDIPICSSALMVTSFLESRINNKPTGTRYIIELNVFFPISFRPRKRASYLEMTLPLKGIRKISRKACGRPSFLLFPHHANY